MITEMFRKGNESKQLDQLELARQQRLREKILEKRGKGEKLTEEEEYARIVWLAEEREEETNDLKTQNRR